MFRPALPSEARSTKRNGPKIIQEMRLSHLTFGQLYKLASARTIMRVDSARTEAVQAYHNKDDRAYSWHYVRRFDYVLDFLRGPEVKAALKAAAAAQEIPYMPGASLELCRIPFRHNRALMFAHARIVYTFCKLAGAVPVIVQDDRGPVVRVDTTPLGIAALNYKPGLKWKTICQECAIENLRSPFDIFWWLTPIIPLRENDRLNPAVWPCNTPDVAAIAESLVTRAS
jgi:hypothetical protein